MTSPRCNLRKRGHDNKSATLEGLTLMPIAAIVRPLQGRDKLPSIISFRRFRCASPTAIHSVALQATRETLRGTPVRLVLTGNAQGDRVLFAIALSPEGATPTRISAAHTRRDTPPLALAHSASAGRAPFQGLILEAWRTSNPGRWPGLE